MIIQEYEKLLSRSISIEYDTIFLMAVIGNQFK